MQVLPSTVFTAAHAATQASSLGPSPTALQDRQNGKLESQHSETSQLLLLHYEPLAVGFWGVGGSRSGSTRALVSHPLGCCSPGNSKRNWLLIPASVLATWSLVKHAENVTSSATRPIEPFHRSLRNFLFYVNKRQAYRKNSSSQTSGNSSSKNTY